MGWLLVCRCMTLGYRECHSPSPSLTTRYPPARYAEEGLNLIQSPWETLQSISGASTKLWDADVRSELSRPRWKKSDLDLRRNHLAVPGSRLHAGVNDDRVPVILFKSTVQSGTPGQEASGFHGYTLLIPCGWSMAFLPSFVFCNARLGGLVERRVRCREAGVPSFPEHYSSVCNAAEAWELQQSQEDEVRWLRKPPGKRPEFSTLGTRWPFRPVWGEVLVVREHTTIGADVQDATGASAEERATNGNTELRTWLFNSALTPCVTQLAATADPSQRLFKVVNAFRQRRGLAILPPSVTHELFTGALCQVQVEMIGRGSPSDMATISELDEAERGAWLDAHARDQLAGARHSSTSAMLEVSLALSLWLTRQLGEKPCDTGVIGFVTSGNISLVRGEGHALAMISLAGYLHLLAAARSSSQPELAVVKVKNRDGHVFRLASVTLVQ